jgi:iron complex outermembrane receptor protein
VGRKQRYKSAIKFIIKSLWLFYAGLYLLTGFHYHNGFPMRRIFLFALGFVITNLITLHVYAKEGVVPDPEFDEILSRDISDLTVTSVAKRSQRLSDTAAAVYVITQEDLRRVGIYSIPEALRLVPGVQVAKVSGNRWAVSARGFNSTVNNKLLVLIDGRAVYTPVYGGVYWDDQSTSVNDIDRIEVIRGPGGSLYGANATNGVINIITKSAENTQGNMVSAITSSKGNGLYEARHGGQAENNGAYYRTYAQYLDSDSWYRGRGGFRVDGRGADRDTYTIQGDAYIGDQDVKLLTPLPISPLVQTVASTDDSYGGDVLGRWNHKISRDSELSLQAYVDHYSRLESNFAQHVSTADIQAQHSIRLDKRNNFIWGGGARLYYEDLTGTFSASVDDQYSVHDIFNIFAQDEYALLPDTLYLTAGSKFEYNDFTGFEVQPSVRMSWHPADNQTVWGAISRAVRTPSSIENDVDVVALVTEGPPVTELHILGNKEQKSEELIAYEIGHRIQPTKNLSLDTALFFNDFDNLQTIATPGATFTGANGNDIVPYIFNNLGSGHVYGVELAANWNVTNKWRLGGSYTYLKMSLDVKPGTATTLEAGEKLAPRNQFSVQSYYNISDTVHWDNMLYYVDNLSAPVNAYVRYDTRIAWLAMPGMEVSLIGRNLLDPHVEFPSASASEVDRGLIGQVLWKF